MNFNERKKMFRKTLILIALCCSTAFADEKFLNLKHSTNFVVFPADTNANFPMLFGGKTLAEMDRCAAITTRRFLYDSPNKTYDYVTVGINDIKFHKAAEVKDLVFVSGEVTKAGEKSITVQVKVEREILNVRELLANGEFVFVSYDTTTRKAIPHGIILR